MNCLLIYCTINWLFLWWHIFCYFTYWFFHEFILKNHKNGLWNLKKIQICLIFAYRVICITRRIKGKEFKIFKGYRNNKICLPLSCWADGCPAVVSSQSPERQCEGADLSSSTADYDHGPPDTYRLLQPCRTLRQYVPSKHLYTHKYSWIVTFMD